MAEEARRARGFTRAAGDGDAAPLAVIWPLLGRHIAFHRRLVDLTSSVKAALLLSQSIYWTRHGRDIARNGGWFHKTTEQWAIETGLSPKEQASAREVLRNLALLDDPADRHSRAAAFQVEAGRARRAARRSDCRPSAGGRLERSARARGTARSVGGLPPDARRGRGWRARRADAVARAAPHAAAGSTSSGPVDRQLGRALVPRSSVSRGANRKRRGAISCVPGSGRNLRGIPPSLVARIRLDRRLLALLTEDVSPARATDLRGVDPERDVGAANDSPKSDSTVATPQPCRAESATTVRPDPRTRFTRKRRSSYESQYR